MRRHIVPSVPGRALTVLLIVCLLVPLVIAILWGDIYSDAAYQQFRGARAVARGVERPWNITGSPLYTALLALLTRLPWSLPAVALPLSALGWITAIGAWFLVGLALGQPIFAAFGAVLLALHPLQPQVLGMESGLVLGLVGLAMLWAVRGKSVAMLVMLVILIAFRPTMLGFAAPLFVLSWVWRQSSPTLAQVVAGVAVGAIGYALLYLRGDANAGDVFSQVRLMVPLLAALQLVVAAGLAFAMPHFIWLTRPWAEKRALGSGVGSLCVLALVFWQANTLLGQWRLRPADRLASYKTVAQWLHEHSLPSETVGASQSGLVGFLSDRDAVALPDTTQTSLLLDAVHRLRPEYCVAPDSLAWYGVQAQPWFQERYQEVFRLASPYDSAAPLTLFRYTPSPFDTGDIENVAVRFTPETQEWIELIGYRLESRRITPGEALHLTLYWHAATTLNQPLFLVLRLMEAATGKVWVKIENLAPGGLATDLWNAGMRFVDRYTLMAPADLPPGDYVLDVALYPRDDSAAPILVANQGEALRREPLELAQVYRPPNVSDTPLTPDHPLEFRFGDKIELMGYDAPKRIGPGDELRVALYWHALGSVSLNYKVFVHLFGPDDQLLAQDDGLPVNWTYPSTNWQPGEHIRDEHVLKIDPSAPRGDYTLLVGLYDSATGERAFVRDAAGGEIAERRVLLERIQVR